MVAYITDFGYASITSTPYDQYINANSPRILIENLANKANVLNFPGSTLASNPEWLATLQSTGPAERWKSVDSPSHIFTMFLGSGNYATINSVGFCAHRGLIGRQCIINVIKDSVVVKSIGPFIITKSTPVFKIFEDVECDGVIINFSSFEPFSIEVGVISIGKSIALPRNIYVGHTPITYGRNPKSRFVTSDNGNFLGQSTEGITLESAVDMDNIPQGYYDDILFPYFQLPAETTPFFWAWRPEKYPDQVGYCWIPGGRVQMKNSKANGFRSMSFNMNGYVSNGQ